MTAQPLLDPDPDDPAEILRALPQDCAEIFLAEYREAMKLAQDPAAFPAVRKLLRLWRLRAVMSSDPGYQQDLAKLMSGDHSGSVPLDDLLGAQLRK